MSYADHVKENLVEEEVFDNGDGTVAIVLRFYDNSKLEVGNSDAIIWDWTYGEDGHRVAYD